MHRAPRTCRTAAPTWPPPMPSGCSTTRRWATSSSSPVPPVRSNRPRASVSGSTTLPPGRPRAPSSESWGESVPPELVQPVVVDAEMMGDLVHHRDRHLVQDLLARVAHAQLGSPEDGLSLIHISEPTR